MQKDSKFLLLEFLVVGFTQYVYEMMLKPAIPNGNLNAFVNITVLVSVIILSKVLYKAFTKNK